MRVGFVSATALAATIVILSAPTSAAAGSGRPVGGLHPGSRSFFAPPPSSQFPISIPPPIANVPKCKAGQIESVAFTKPAPGGVLGVIELEGTKFYRAKPFGMRRCRLPLSKGPRSLLAADGAALDVPRGRPDSVNPANNFLAGSALRDGKAAWGFGWYGSYCGPAPRYLVMKLRAGLGVLHVPYDGPVPTCAAQPADSGTSVLVDGPAGGPAAAVEPAPRSYRDLRTSARFIGTTTTKGPAPVEVSISDTSQQPVPLVPCPEYLVQTADRTGNQPHGGSLVIDGATPGCNRTDLVVRPDHPITFRLSRTELAPGTHFAAARGSTFDVRVAMAGMPTAEVSTTVRAP